ncbi:hypothetical protein [Trichocoleus sp. FACHB-262]|uniref:hypothetical protein n=1 Tax=Trichocoleus sp. FACHB-262 TaxID=2692869 RepID=UPI0016845E15|nr:hypothetical protein [Trichocoleus sp. FACHB-262]MBD2124749.1 hypothetical protein [Trichocoleus sp. FACHB-262]
MTSDKIPNPWDAVKLIREITSDKIPNLWDAVDLIHEITSDKIPNPGDVVEPIHEMTSDKIPHYWDAVKLIHVEELRTWHSFKRCQDFKGISYREYLLGSKHIEKLRSEVSKFLDVKKRLDEIDHNELVVYDTFYITVPGSLSRKKQEIALMRNRLRATVINSEFGNVKNAALIVETGWFKREVKVSYSCPSRVLYEDEIRSLRKKLSEMNEDEKQKVAEVQQSKFTQPVLFVSHRWESKEHPDPLAKQLPKLCLLENCFIIYDYSSFPQIPRSKSEEADFQQIMKNMNELIKNVVILHSPDYMSRGWCVYEYIVSSLKCSIVCDEVQHPDFVSLRNWTSTIPPIPYNLFHDGFESMQQNYINEQILVTVNRLLPVYKNSCFRTEYDNSYVTGLLRQHLMSKLPSKKQQMTPYLGEWKTELWTEEEISAAFDKELQWPKQKTTPTEPNSTNVPDTITKAVNRQYKIDKQEFGKLLSQWLRFR